MKLMKVAVAVTAFFLFCGMGLAQNDWRWQQRDEHQGVWDTNRSKEYNNGIRDGRNDRAHNRSAHPRHNDAEYMSGYRAGYGSGNWRDNHRRDRDHDRDRDRDHDRDRDRDRDRDHEARRGPGAYGQPQNAQRIGYDNGLREGLRVGEGDRAGRKGYRCTTSDLYKHGTAGYMSSYGDQNLYRQNFQQGYRTGYDRAYYGR